MSSDRASSTSRRRARAAPSCWGSSACAHELLLAGTEEDAEALERVLAGESPAGYVQRVTALKLDAAVARRAAPGIARGADPVRRHHRGARPKRILGKPDDAQDARRMLAQLAGRTHRVLTAVALPAWRPARTPRSACRGCASPR